MKPNKIRDLSNKFLFIVIIIFSFILSSQAQVLAQEKILFLEEFSDPVLDGEVWTFSQNDGKILLQDNKLVLSSDGGNSFPYLYLKPGFFPNNEKYTLEIKFNYSSIAYWGVGIGIGRVIPENGRPLGSLNPQKEEIYTFVIWQESTCGLRVGYQRCTSDGSCEIRLIYPYPNTGNECGVVDNKTHLFRLNYSPTTKLYELFLDEQNIANLDFLPELTTIWIGNPFTLTGSLPWTSLEIDYIKIVSLEDFSAPLLLLPGLGASWNTEAMVYNKVVDDNQWKMTPFVNTYNRFIETAQDNGYQLGENFFVWNYDWRKSLGEIATDLNEFISSNPKLQSNLPIDLVGHSLGGLVARTWIQNFDTGQEKKVRKLITVGSPHYGVVQAYGALAGGKVGEKVDLSWLALQLLLEIHRNGFETNAQIIRNLTPILQDITPTFQFARKNNTPLPVNQMAFANHYLENLNQTADILPFSKFVLGNTGETTPECLVLNERSLIDKLLDLWPDGYPQEVLKGVGDDTVLKKSAYFGDGYDPDLEFNLNHHQIINDPTAVEEIFNLLGKSEIQSKGPDVYPEDNLLIFYLASPATLKVNGIAPEINDLQFIAIPNPLEGDYNVEIAGTDSGWYHLYLGQITPSGNFWHTYTGEIAAGQTNTFTFAIDFGSPLPDPLIDNNGILHLNQAKELLTELYNQTNNKILLISLNQLDKAIQAFDQGRWHQGINDLKNSLRSLSLYRIMLKNEQIVQYNQAGEIMKLITAGWEKILQAHDKPSEDSARREYRTAEQKLALALKFLEKLDWLGRKIAKMNALSVKSAEDLLGLVKAKLEENDFSYVESFSFLANLFAQEGFIPR